MAAVTPQQDRVLAARQQIWARAEAAIADRVSTVEGAVIALVEGRLDEDLRAAAEREAHKLAGSAGTFGLPRASELARELELLLGAPPPGAATAVRAAELVEAMAAEVRRGPAPVAPAGGTSTLLVVTRDSGRSHAIATAARGRGLSTEAVADLHGAAEVHARRHVDATLVLLAGSGLDPADADALRELGLADPATLVVLAGTALGTQDRLLAAGAGVRGFADVSAPASALVDAVRAGLDEVREHLATVLFVDDDPTLLAAVRELFAATEMRVVTLDDPLRFWDVLVAEAPDLLVLDIGMPGVDGPQLCRLVRSDDRWRRVPIVFLSAARDPDRIREVFAAGADDFVAKPVMGPELLARLRNRLERVRLHRRLAEADPLTGLANRRRLQEGYAGLARRPRGEAAALALLDVDHLKRINGVHGHTVGDLVLQQVAAVLRGACTDSDLAAHVGAGEFAVLMPGTPADAAMHRIEQALEAPRREGVPAGRGATLQVGVSGGVVECPADPDGFEAAYRAADAALMRAKATGGDRVLVGATALPAANGPPSGSVSGGVDVVVVEDDEVVAELLRHAVDTAGYRCVVITDGEEAVNRLTGRPPQVTSRSVLLDVDLPSRSGIEVLRALRKDGVLARTTVTMVTGRTTEHDVIQALAEGAVDHIAKPFSIPVLVHKLRRTLGG